MSPGKKLQQTKPSHWPQEIQYIQASRYHASVLPEIRQFIIGAVSTTCGQFSERCRSWVIIRVISNISHPACGQRGLFAAKKIPPRTRLLDYIGEIHCDDRPNSDYDLSLYRTQDGVNVGIDASTMGNEARFINDYRGVQKKPNAAFSDARTSSGELRMSIWSSDTEIKKDEEILVSYGKAWWRERYGVAADIEHVVDT
ncbi:SET domain protein [Crucibulum laeve]|uniref:SET domain protein n=1 Tax=Crucibulum laeve TaxID=68775 RepID=A0A5C3M7E7_9AGAR|nr:SET domain protein [Crucibulum laeve]